MFKIIFSFMAALVILLSGLGNASSVVILPEDIASEELLDTGPEPEKRIITIPEASTQAVVVVQATPSSQAYALPKKLPYTGVR